MTANPADEIYNGRIK